MTTKAEIRQSLEGVTHASQTKGVVAQLLDYLHEAGVRTPAEIEQEQRMYSEQRHRQLAEIQDLNELKAQVDQWVEDGVLDEDPDLARAANERGNALREQSESVYQEPSGYAVWDRPRLQAEAKRRELSATGTKDELVARLQADDAAKAEADQ